jgi:hypothetical protein
MMQKGGTGTATLRLGTPLVFLMQVAVLLMLVLPSSGAKGKGRRQMNAAVERPIEQYERDLGDGTPAFDTDNLICQVGGSDDEDEDEAMTHIDFHFWYAMGVKGDVGIQDMLLLERKLFLSIEDDLLWCWGEDNTFVESGQGGRELLVKQSQRRRFTREARELGIIAFTQGGLDNQTERKFLFYPSLEYCVIYLFLTQ